MPQRLLPSPGHLSSNVRVNIVNIGSDFKPPRWLPEIFYEMEEKEIAKHWEEMMDLVRQSTQLGEMRLKDLAKELKGAKQKKLAKNLMEVKKVELAKLLTEMKLVELEGLAKQLEKMKQVELAKPLTKMKLVELMELAKQLEKMEQVELAKLLKEMELGELGELAKQLEELAKLLKRKKQVNASQRVGKASQLQTSLSTLLSKPKATWKLCSLSFLRVLEVKVIHIESHVICVDMVSRQHAMSFGLTQGTIESLSKIYGEIYLANWDEKMLKAMQAVFEKACSEFMYHTDITVLQELQKNGCVMLPADDRKAVETEILSLLETSSAQHNANYTKANDRERIASPYAVHKSDYPPAIYWPSAISENSEMGLSAGAPHVPPDTGASTWWSAAPRTC